MSQSFPSSLPLFITIVFTTVSCSTNGLRELPQRASSAADQSELREMGQKRLAWGELIYTGAVFQRNEYPAQQLFSYERRVRPSGSGMQAGHITRNLYGQVIVDETAETDSDYSLRRFEARNSQQGYHGVATVSINEQRLEFVVTKNGITDRATEKVTDPLVCGPSLFGFVREHWARLARGEAMRVQLISMEAMKTYRFRIHLTRSKGGLMDFTVTPTNLLVRLFVSPLIITYESDTGFPVRYQGLVPPMLERDGRKRALNARVDYTKNSDRYW